MKKRIICFANSRKPDGKCFAGKEVNGENWIRPVSDRTNGSLHHDEECIRDNDCKCKICNPIIPSLLDVIEIDLGDYVGEGHQVENYLLGSNKWKKIGTLKHEYIDCYLDSFATNLWVNGYETYNRKNDRIPSKMGHLLNDSLRLIEVQALTLHVVIEGAGFGNPRKKVNGIFRYNKIEYIIPITDELIENQYLDVNEGRYAFPSLGKRIILCLSMGKEYKGYIYKFIAGVITI